MTYICYYWHTTLMIPKAIMKTITIHLLISKYKNAFKFGKTIIIFCSCFFLTWLNILLPTYNILTEGMTRTLHMTYTKKLLNFCKAITIMFWPSLFFIPLKTLLCAYKSIKKSITKDQNMSEFQNSLKFC